MYLFNVRVYGILVNEQGEVLISDERTENVSFTKFPGGGLEYGEGLLDALKREYMEETGLEVEVLKHIYTTDFWEKSSFNDSQIISIYYQVNPINKVELNIKTKKFDFTEKSVEGKLQSFRLIPVDKLKSEDLTFKTDQVAWVEFLKTVDKIEL
ncbi:NUDIX domain-containing protein [Sphingobacterium sp. DK4209]|uniref:NUDIX domain-containing protein n=1 Tax=Sphingobacterium zhuxiongii TaxID=2662364 RepID=A0A5Q0Q6K9_9SPHI|nr:MULTISPECIES: NUDIX domain-containing protein [unclassified Sphingobacterium]MVZ64339.1 NUDIX domain-containing protein [Sphingobacterium sp. DK4209]QGA25687.1 NUDIX domain-containing protein [Sphingobacterium sp. dk4302]